MATAPPKRKENKDAKIQMPPREFNRMEDLKRALRQGIRLLAGKTEVVQKIKKRKEAVE